MKTRQLTQRDANISEEITAINGDKKNSACNCEAHRLVMAFGAAFIAWNDSPPMIRNARYVLIDLFDQQDELVRYYELNNEPVKT